MCRHLDNRAGHWLLLAVTWAVLCLPRLGGPSLWDIDEGNNSDAAREMFESGDWVVPRFNNEIRYDKPVLLYWLQAGCYATFGVNEFAARLPSALAALLTILVTYELGRGMFGGSAGLLAGVALGSCPSFCASAHFANPDALLNLFTALTLWCWWQDYAGRGRAWYVMGSVAAGLGVLAKGPVGLVLPLSVLGLFYLWSRQWRRLMDRRLPWAVLAFLAAAAPWYIWVGVETKGHWLLEFWQHHNYERALRPLENHRGPVGYYLLVLLAGFAPWSVFLGPTAWLTWRQVHRGADMVLRPAFQFLVCWFAVYFVFFSIVSTKLPNYILPLYPPTAVLTGYCLDRWRRQQVDLPAWVLRTSLSCLALMGLGVAVGLLVASGRMPLPVLRGRYLPGLESCALLGGLWVSGAGLAAWCWRQGSRGGLIASVAFVAVAFCAGAAAWGAVVVDQSKAPRALAGALPPDQTRRDLRIATFDYFQPSLVFYCRRRITRLDHTWKLFDFLCSPLPAYAIVPASTWESFRAWSPRTFRVVARHYDLYDGHEVVLVTNENSSQ
jgi:4-amino-4-deoxy-L-arabinose transferase-like glycosyltransferase